jgi:hypothetical protein
MKYAILLLLFSCALFYSCNNKKEEQKFSDTGNVICNFEKLKYDFDVITAIKAIGKDSIERRELWSKIGEYTINQENYLNCNISGLTNISVRQSNDSIFIYYGTPYADEKGNIALAGTSYNITISKNKYTFIDKSWTDARENDEIKNECSTLFINKPNYKIGDTLIGGVTIKRTRFVDGKYTSTFYLKFVINSLVQK